MYRKTYQENHMDKSVIVKFNNNEDYELIKKGVTFLIYFLRLLLTLSLLLYFPY